MIVASVYLFVIIHLHFYITVPLAPTNVHADPTRTTTSGFRIVWDYDTSRSRVTQWKVRHAELGRAWTERSLTDPNVKEAFFTLNLADSGKTFRVEIIANSDGASSIDNVETQVTLSKQMIFLKFNLAVKALNSRT